MKLELGAPLVKTPVQHPTVSSDHFLENLSSCSFGIEQQPKVLAKHLKKITHQSLLSCE